jgi:hypothetical protein
MTFAKIRLGLAALLFAGWLGWLAYAVANKGTVQVVSRAQLLVIEVKDASGAAIVKENLRGETASGEIAIVNWRTAVLPLSDRKSSDTLSPGVYLVAVNKVVGNQFSIAGLPRSPGIEAQTAERPLVYPWNDDVQKQVQALLKKD